MKNNPIEVVDDLKVIRTIHSNKAMKFDNLNVLYLIITLVIAVVVTFIGFSGPGSILSLFNSSDVPRNDTTKTVIKVEFLHDSSVNKSTITIPSKAFSIPFDSIIKNQKHQSDITFIMKIMTLLILVIAIFGLIVSIN